MSKKKIAIIGATGYTGSELVRILLRHPSAEISLITSESRAGERFSAIHPAFQGIADLVLEPVSSLKTQTPDMVFLALPHGVSMNYAKEIAQRNIPVVDLSGDFRLSSPSIYEDWYNKEHRYPEGFEGAVYGLPELFREQIPGAGIIANPGCYPTSVLLGIAPLLNAGLVDTGRIIADCKSGVTGAGASPKAANHFSSVHDDFKAYGLMTHRHTIEIEEQSNALSSGEVNVQFTPHLLPLDRGILSTLYLRPLDSGLTEALLHKTYQDYYAEKPFVRILEQLPSLKKVRGSNYCDIHTTFDPRTGNIIVISAIDNLVKGAAGQAVQNMNIYFGMKETLGLEHIPLSP